MFENWAFLIAEIWGHLLIAVLLTLLLAWFFWGYSGTNARRAQLAGLQEELAQSQDQVRAKEAELDHAAEKQEHMRSRMAAIQEKLTGALAAQDDMRQQSEQDQLRLSQVLASQTALEAELSDVRREIAELETSHTNNATEASSATAWRPVLRSSYQTAKSWAGRSIAKGKNVYSDLRGRIGR